MRIFVGNTDASWYRFLRDEGLTSEANFWRPRAQDKRVTVISPGELFFFRLKSPVSAIAGYGVFRHHTVLPLALAWETFGEANGCSTFESLARMIGVHHPEDDLRTAGDWMIGCTLLSNLVFYPDRLWLNMPLAPGIVRGKSFDPLEAEGSRIWSHMLEVSGHDSAGIAASPDPFAPLSGGQAERLLISVKHRQQQGLFRTMVVDAYERRCCVTGEHTLPVIDAAHIQPYVSAKSNDITNGLALRKDIHTLFDHGYAGVDDEYRFIVSPRLDQNWHNGRVYYDLQGKPIRLPKRVELVPSLDALRWHRATVFQD